MNEYMILGFVIIVAFIAYKKYTQAQVLKLVPSLIEQGAQIIDVRTKKEFATSNKKGSINIPVEILQDNLKKIDKNKAIILCCASGSRSALAKRILLSKGFENVHNAGTWRALLRF